MSFATLEITVPLTILIWVLETEGSAPAGIGPVKGFWSKLITTSESGRTVAVEPLEKTTMARAPGAVLIVEPCGRVVPASSFR